MSNKTLKIGHRRNDLYSKTDAILTELDLYQVARNVFITQYELAENRQLN